MKITFFAHYGDWAYGSNRSLVNLIDGLKARDIQMLVISPKDGTLREALGSRGVPMFIAPFARWMSTQRSPIGALRRLRRNFKCLPSLAAHLRDWGCDVVYTNSSVIPIGALVSKRISKPHIWHIREFGEMDWDLKRDWGDWGFNWLVGQTAARIAVSNAIRSQVFPDDIARRTEVVYNGIAFEDDFVRLFELNRAYELRQNHRFTFAIIGSLRPSKGQDKAIRALSYVAKKHLQARLLIVGDGQQEYVAACKNLASSLGIAEKVEFWGYLNDPYEVMLEADVVLMCSENEGMGRVTVEAMAACRPVIGFDNAGTSELIEHGRNGLLYRNGVEDLADCMTQLVQNPAWAKQMGKQAWEIARHKYTIEKYAKRVYDVIEMVYQRHNQK